MAFQDGTVQQSYAGGGSPPLPDPPAEIQGHVRQVATDDHYSLAILDDGTVVDWGNWYGSGNHYVPEGLDHVVGISVGYQHGLAVRDDGSIVCWGVGTTDGPYAPPSDLDHVVEVAAGNRQLYARKADGTVVGWGYDAFVPADLANVKKIAAVQRHSGALALTADGSVTRLGTVNNLPDVSLVTGVTDLVSGPSMILIVQRTPIVLQRITQSVWAGSTDILNVKILLDQTYDHDIDVSLTATGTSLMPPATVTIPAGTTEQLVEIPHDVHVGAGSNTITASLDGHTSTIGVSMFQMTLGEGVVGSANGGAPFMYGGHSYPVYVKTQKPVARNTIVYLRKRDPNGVLGMPFRVVIPKGDYRVLTTFDAKPVTVNTHIATSQTFYNTDEFPDQDLPWQDGLVMVDLPLQAMIALPQTGYGNSKVLVRVYYWYAPPPDGYTIHLSSSDGSLKPIDGFIPADAKDGHFDFYMEATDIPSRAYPQLTASSAGSSVHTNMVLYANLVDKIELSSSSVQAGEDVTATVTMKAPVAVDTVVDVWLSHPKLGVVPATVTIPAGSATASFTVETKDFVGKDFTIYVHAGHLNHIQRAALNLHKN